MDWGLIALSELGIFCIQMVVFVVLYGTRSAWKASPLGRVLLPFLVIIAVSFIGFFALAMVDIPGWIFAAVFAAGNVLMVLLLRLLIRAQRQGG